MAVTLCIHDYVLRMLCNYNEQRLELCSMAISGALLIPLLIVKLVCIRAVCKSADLYRAVVMCLKLPVLDQPHLHMLRQPLTLFAAKFTAFYSSTPHSTHQGLVLFSSTFLLLSSLQRGKERRFSLCFPVKTS